MSRSLICMARLTNQLNIGLGCVNTRSEQPTESTSSVKKVYTILWKNVKLAVCQYINKTNLTEFLDFQTIVSAFLWSIVSRLFSV